MGRYLEVSQKVLGRYLEILEGSRLWQVVVSASPISDTLSDVSLWYTRTDSSSFEICSNHLTVASPRDLDRSVSPATTWKKEKVILYKQELKYFSLKY